MQVDIANLREVLEDGSVAFFREYRDDIVRIGDEITTEEEWIELSECFELLKLMAKAMADHNMLIGEPEQARQTIQNALAADKGLLMIREAMEGDNINPHIQLAVEQREVAAGRLDKVSETVVAGAAVIGDPLIGKFDRSKGDNTAKAFWWMAGAAGVAAFFSACPWWVAILLAVAGFVTGYFVNNHEAQKANNEIRARRANGEKVTRGRWVRYSLRPIQTNAP